MSKLKHWNDRYKDIKPEVIRLRKENPDCSTAEIIAMLRDVYTGRLPSSDTIRRWCAAEGVPITSCTGFSPRYKAQAIELAKSIRHWSSLEAHLDPDARGKKPKRYAVQRWLKDAGAWMGQEAKGMTLPAKPRPRPKPKRVDLSTPYLCAAVLEIIDPDLYADSRTAMLRNLWGRLYPDGSSEVWLVLRMWIAGGGGDRLYRIVPEKREPVSVWARTTAEFIEKLEAIGYRIRYENQAMRAAA